MSTIKIAGYASKTVDADLVEFNIKFYSKDINTSRATENTRKQTETFLKCCKILGNENFNDQSLSIVRIRQWNL